MAERRFKVRVFVKAETSGDPAREDLSRAFNLQASHADKAALFARVRLEEQGLEVVSVSHAPENGIVVTVGREPRKGPPTTLVAHVARERPRPVPAPRKKGARR